MGRDLGHKTKVESDSQFAKHPFAKSAIVFGKQPAGVMPPPSETPARLARPGQTKMTLQRWWTWLSRPWRDSVTIDEQADSEDLPSAECKYPRPDRSNFRPNYEKSPENETISIGWNAGRLTDGRPYHLDV